MPLPASGARPRAWPMLARGRAAHVEMEDRARGRGQGRPALQKLNLAKDQKKTLIFRIARDSEGKDVTLAYLKERFGGLIYSSWFVKQPSPFAHEPWVTGWAPVDLDPLPHSFEKTYQEQLEYAKTQGTRLKTPGPDAYDLLVADRVTGRFFRGSPLNGRTGTVVHEEPVTVRLILSYPDDMLSRSDPNGINIHRSRD